MNIAKKFYTYDLTRKDSGYQIDFEAEEKPFLNGGRYNILTDFINKKKIMTI